MAKTKQSKKAEAKKRLARQKLFFFIRVLNGNGEQPILKTSHSRVLFGSEKFNFDCIISKLNVIEKLINVSIRPFIKLVRKGYNLSLIIMNKFELEEQEENLKHILQTFLNLLSTKYPSTGLSISFVEIHNEKVFDLLDTLNQGHLNVEQVRAEDYKIWPITNWEETEYLYQTGIKNMSMKKKFSTNPYQSTNIITIYVQNQHLKKRCMFNLVNIYPYDLYSKVTVLSKHLINLKTVIESYCGGWPVSKVPYECSSLTRVLKHSLNLTSYVQFYGVVDPTSNNPDEPLSLLEYSSSLRKIKVERSRTERTILARRTRSSARLEENPQPGPKSPPKQEPKATSSQVKVKSEPVNPTPVQERRSLQLNKEFESDRKDSLQPLLDQVPLVPIKQELGNATMNISVKQEKPEEGQIRVKNFAKIKPRVIKPYIETITIDSSSESSSDESPKIKKEKQDSFSFTRPQQELNMSIEERQECSKKHEKKKSKEEKNNSSLDEKEPEREESVSIKAKKKKAKKKVKVEEQTEPQETPKKKKRKSSNTEKSEEEGKGKKKKMKKAEEEDLDQSQEEEDERGNAKAEALRAHKAHILSLLNKGTVKDVQKLHGVGLKTAEQIVTFRNLNGDFGKIKHLKRIPGWTDIKFEKFQISNMLK